MKKALYSAIAITFLFSTTHFCVESQETNAEIEKIKEQISLLEKGEKKTAVEKPVKEERKEASIEKENRAIKLSYLHLDLGNLYSESGWYDEAINEYRKAHSIYRLNSSALYNTGILHQRRGKFSAAASSFRSVIRINPRNAAAYFNLGAALESMGQSRKAMSEYKTALEMNPELGKIEKNPSVLNSKLIPTVNLLIYRETIGASSLSLEETPEK